MSPQRIVFADVVVHPYNPSYSGGKGRSIMILGDWVKAKDYL
jgi:hypothetical protein